MKILIGFAGIGGESELWDDINNNITHVEIDPKIAQKIIIIPISISKNSPDGILEITPFEKTARRKNSIPDCRPVENGSVKGGRMDWAARNV